MRIQLADATYADRLALFLDDAGFLLDPSGVLPMEGADAQARRALELRLIEWNDLHPEALAHVDE